jgi:hypothetical protein
MSRIALAMLAAVLVGGAAPAAAGPFGGFSGDQTRYLSGRDQVCTPLRVVDSGSGSGPGAGPGAVASPPASQAVPACEPADDRRIAAMKFRRGVVQQGARADFEASARGTEIAVRDRRSGRVLVTWSAVDPVERVTGVYAGENADPRAPGALVAVEYEVRVGGRTRTETVAFLVVPAARAPAAPAGPAGPAGQAAPAPDTADPAPAPSPPAAAPAPDDPRVAERLAKARRLDARNQGRAAEAAYRQVLELDADHPEARYGLARSLARQRKHPAAIEALAALAQSRRPEAGEWLVEARFDRVFRGLRSDPAFRAAAGLDRDRSQPRSLYERLLGFSDTWEQAEVKCEQAEVRLSLDRRARKFRLTITTRCGGYPTTTRLQGSFRLGEAERVDLVLPNTGGAEETVACRMQLCSSEDCLQCVVDEDLSFTLLPVRR